MKTKNLFYSFIFLFAFFSGCTSSDDSLIEDVAAEDVDLDLPIENNDPNTSKTYKILSLGDSYTIGESVCSTCRFPVQLTDSLVNKFKSSDTFSLKIIARTGWTTIVVSIPDYAFTPFGNGDTNISADIDRYNNFAQNYCTINNISYIYITEITRLGLIDTSLVASDGLHPSELAYTKFAQRILPLALEKLNN